jgi:hypothetical protein
VYVTGQTSSNDFPVANGVESSYNGGLGDAFITKIDLTNPPHLFLKAPATVVGQGQEFRVDIQVQPVGMTFDTIEAHLGFDPKYLEVVTITSALSSNQHDVDNETGQIDFFAWETDSPFFSNELTAATIRFRAKAATDVTRITLQRIRARQSDLFSKGKSLTPALSGGTVRILSGVLLNGQVRLEQRGPVGSPRWITNLARTTDSGSTGGITLYQGGTALGRFGTTTDSQGRFAVSLDGFESYPYTIRVKGDTTLSNLLHNVDLKTTDPIDFGTLRVGDSTGDDQINGADVSYLVPAFGRSATNNGFRPYGDVTKDGTINSADVTALTRNFLETGMELVPEPETTCPATPSQPSTGNPAPAFSLLPSDLVLQPNQAFTMTLALDLHTRSADTIDIYLDLDTKDVELQQIDQHAPTSIVLDPGLGGVATYNKVTNNDGHQQINLSVTRYAPPFFTGHVLIATLPLHVTTPAAKTIELKPVQIGSRHSDVLLGGVSLQPTCGGGLINVNGIKLDHSVYIPITFH